MSDFLRISSKIKSVIEYVLGRLSSITMIVMVLFALAEIIRRYIFCAYPFKTLAKWNWQKT